MTKRFNAGARARASHAIRTPIKTGFVLIGKNKLQFEVMFTRC